MNLPPAVPSPMRHSTQVLTCYSLPGYASRVRAQLLVYILKDLLQRFIIDLQTSVASPEDAHGYYICHNHQVPSVPSLCQSTLLALLVSALVPLKDLSLQVWLREGEVEEFDTWNTSVQESSRILESIHRAPFPPKPHNCNTAAKLQINMSRITAALQARVVPKATLSYMEKQRAKLGNLTFPTP